MKYGNGTMFLDGGVREKTSLESEGSLKKGIPYKGNLGIKDTVKD